MKTEEDMFSFVSYYILAVNQHLFYCYQGSVQDTALLWKTLLTAFT